MSNRHISHNIDADAAYKAKRRRETEFHYQADMANAMYQLDNDALVDFLRRYPDYAERLRVALNNL